MKNVELRIAEFLVRRDKVLALLCLISLVVPLYFLRNVRIDNSTEVWLGESAEYESYQRFLDKYGNEEFIVIASEANDPLGEDSLAFQKRLAERIEAIEHVDRVFDLATVADLLSTISKDWQKLLREESLLHNLLLGEDGHTYGMIVYLERIDDPAVRSIAVEKIQTAVTEVAGGKAEMHFAGTALMDLALDKGSRKASRQFLPIAALLSVIFLAIILRSFGAVAAVMCSLGVTTIWTMGLLVAAGKTINMITVAIPSLLFVLAVSGGIHITSRFIAFLPVSESRSAAMRDSLVEVMRPIFLSNVTTAVGFGSLTISSMQPVVEFGTFTALGIMLSFFFNVTIIPGILCMLHRTAVRAPLIRGHWTAKIGVLMVRKKGLVLLLGLAVFLISLVLTAKSKVESNVLKFFPEKSEIRRDYQFIGEKLTGFYTMELDATIDNSEGSTLLKALDALGEKIMVRPEVAKVMNYRTLAICFDDIPRPALMPSQSVRKNPLRTMLRTYRYREGGPLSLRMSVFVRAMSSNEYYDLLDFIEAQAKEVIPRQATYEITGVASLSNSAQQSLIDTQIRTLSIASVTILILIGLFMRSLRAMVAAILPNLLPIFGVFALMVLLGIRFDAATVMISSIAIGIAADDTIHFLAHFKREKLLGLSTIDAVDVSMQKAGRAITYTSVVATSGFVILLLAEFQPIQYFGLLTGVTMMVAWAGDVFILPACVDFLRLWDKKQP